MRRRDVLKTGGAMLAGVTAATGLASARGEGELPNGNVPVTEVSSFPERDDPIPVPAGSWIVHRIGWIDGEGGDSTREDVARWLDALDFSATIDEEPVPNAEDYWGEITESDRGWNVYWKYATPPKAPGVYEFTTTFAYPDGFTDGEFTIEPGTVSSLSNDYEVQGRGGRR